MNRSSRTPHSFAAQTLRGALLSVALIAVADAHAAAVGTAANTSISNTVTFSYSYTGVSGATATSTTAIATFVVDRKIDLTLTDHNTAYNSAQTLTPGPGTNPAVLRFTLTNTSNATLDFSLSATDTATDPYGGTDSYDQTTSVFVDFNGDGTYTAGTDTGTFVDELISGNSIAVFIVGSIPGAAINGDISAKQLIATARAGGTASSLGAALTETAGADTAGSMDTVFADGTGLGDASRDAALGARDAFKVISTVLGISKSSTVVSDPTNGVSANAKRISGSVIKYSITINNPPAAPSTAQAVTLTDTIPTNTTFVSGSMVRNAVADPDANGVGNDCDFNVTAAGKITCQYGDLVANTTVTLTFNVTINASQAVGGTISNTGSAAYNIGGVAQTPKTSTHDFLVDRDIKLTLTDQNSAYNSAQTASPAPGSSNAVLRYTLTNTGNGTQDFRLTLADSTDPYGGTDNYDQTASVFVDGNANGTYEIGDAATFVDELASGSAIAVFAVGNIALAQADADISAKLLTAQARIGGTAASEGAALTETAGADSSSTVDILFSDAAGFSDAARDAQLNVRDAFKVVSAKLSVTKTTSVINDPSNGVTNPKRIPGALVRYTLTVVNASGAGASATSTIVSDAIPAGTTYSAASMTLDAVADPDADAGGNDCDFGVTAATTVTCALGAVPANTTRTITFDVTVN